MNFEQSLHDIRDRLEFILERVEEEDAKAHIKNAMQSVELAGGCIGGGGPQPPKPDC